MALSDHPKYKFVPSGRRRPTNATTNKHWSDSQKLEAVTTFLALGNIVLTSNVLKIPEQTLRDWKAKSWWKEIEDELKVQEELQLSTRLKRIIESTLEVTEDRLKNGDFVYDNKTGGLVRKPVNMRDAHKVTMEMLDKRDKIENRTTNSVPLEQIESKLSKLAAKFEAIANNTKRIEVTDVIIMNDPDSPNKQEDLPFDDGHPQGAM